MEIEIRAFGTLKKIVPEGPFQLEKAISLEGFLCLLAEKQGSEFRKAIFDPESKEANPHVCISLNGRMARDRIMKRKLKEKDRVAFFTLLSGGRAEAVWKNS